MLTTEMIINSLEKDLVKGLTVMMLHHGENKFLDKIGNWSELDTEQQSILFKQAIKYLYKVHKIKITSLQEKAVLLRAIRTAEEVIKTRKKEEEK